MLASGVALTGAQQAFRAWSTGKATDSKNDGVLTAQEVANLDLDRTWLVALSACETGVGEARSGEGVFGLRRAFMMSGADYLLMTLWPVADDTTVQIMADFYKEALASGDAAGALSAVQKRWLVKLRDEKGLGAAVRDAGAFAMVQMANPRRKQAAIEKVGNSDLRNNQQAASPQTSDVPQGEEMQEPRVLTFEEALSRADSGEAYAQAVVGTYYTYGYKVEKDEKKALEYLLKSAAQNHPLGIRSIGHRRLNGQGMEKNEQQGLKLISEAFDGLNNMEGDPYALHALASDVLKATMQKVKSGNSKGVSEQMNEFIRLYQLAADKGYAPSQTMLAALLDTTTPESDPERPKRLQQARELLLKALAQNFQEAIETWKEVFPKEPVPNPPSTSEKINNPQNP
jgi:TPR repeat protein